MGVFQMRDFSFVFESLRQIGCFEIKIWFVKLRQFLYGVVLLDTKKVITN